MAPPAAGPPAGRFQPRQNGLILTAGSDDEAQELVLAVTVDELDDVEQIAGHRAVERLLRQTLSQARPHDAFLGEELGRLGESDRVWILDPIDGTGFFSRGDPN